MIILHEIKQDALRGKLCVAIGFGKKPARIPKSGRRDDPQTGYPRFLDQHLSTFEQFNFLKTYKRSKDKSMLVAHAQPIKHAQGAGIAEKSGK
ncbi:hypothetical protein [Roseicyclus sp.]|uniref:hypothetical protein n=1 Tax=Roseicyclus sp. TaxID=1914329 RepID=UPI003F6B1876